MCSCQTSGSSGPVPVCRVVVVLAPWGLGAGARHPWGGPFSLVVGGHLCRPLSLAEPP